jgi:hypothetical protein
MNSASLPITAPNGMDSDLGVELLTRLFKSILDNQPAPAPEKP